MKRYRINKTTTFVEDNHSGNKEKYLIPDYKVQVKFAWIWITVKSFHDEDEEYDGYDDDEEEDVTPKVRNSRKKNDDIFSSSKDDII